MVDIEQLQPELEAPEQISTPEEEQNFFEMLESGELEELSEEELKKFEESNIWEGDPAQLAEDLGVDEDDERVLEISQLAEENIRDEANANRAKFNNWVREHKRLSKAIYITGQLMRIAQAI